MVDLTLWREAWTPRSWSAYLDEAADEEETAEIRRNTHTGRPLGATDFVTGLERMLTRKLTPGRGGRPAKEALDERQRAFAFGDLSS